MYVWRYCLWICMGTEYKASMCTGMYIYGSSLTLSMNRHIVCLQHNNMNGRKDRKMSHHG
ncbi:hypothetical protein GBAR_LOCUS27688 [Geodia barretti]|uniref:Uncharacterized protein n=1 Tax=Geodia barretti TaxID=519541 RepID=A0AA35TLD0_GEOBA|nr:hypothetical protein GBAR_LOCUS27688 [Geodia barretti]